MKKLSTGGMGKKDARINKLINKLYNRKNAHDRSNEMGNTRSTVKE